MDKRSRFSEYVGAIAGILCRVLGSTIHYSFLKIQVGRESPPLLYAVFIQCWLHVCHHGDLHVEIRGVSRASQVPNKPDRLCRLN